MLSDETLAELRAALRPVVHGRVRGLLAEVERLRRALESAGWCLEGQFCPVCRRMRGTGGHWDGCWIGQELKAGQAGRYTSATLPGD